MTIEAQLERIAIALEGFVASQGIVVEPAIITESAPQQELPLSPAPEVDDDLDEMDDVEVDDDLGEDDEPVAPPPPPPPAAKKKKKKRTSKKIGKKVEETSEYSADHVRSKLKDLQIASGSAAEPKSLLKKYGASTFGQLPISKYDRVVADAQEKLDEYE